MDVLFEMLERECKEELDKEMEYFDKKELVSRISLLDEGKLSIVLSIIYKENQNVNLTKNSNGFFVKLDLLSNETLRYISSFLDFVNNVDRSKEDMIELERKREIDLLRRTIKNKRTIKIEEGFECSCNKGWNMLKSKYNSLFENDNDNRILVTLLKVKEVNNNLTSVITNEKQIKKRKKPKNIERISKVLRKLERSMVVVKRKASSENDTVITEGFYDNIEIDDVDDELLDKDEEEDVDNDICVIEEEFDNEEYEDDNEEEEDEEYEDDNEEEEAEEEEDEKDEEYMKKIVDDVKKLSIIVGDYNDDTEEEEDERSIIMGVYEEYLDF